MIINDERKYFWKNDKVNLRTIEERDNFLLEKHLKDTISRKQPDHGIALPATINVANDMVGQAIEATKEGEEIWFGITNNHDVLVGYAVISLLNERLGNAQFSINIFPEYKRNGYGTYTVKILLDFLFYERRFHKVACCVMEENEEGNEFAKSIGMALDAFRSEMFYTNGKYLGEYYYSILREEYDLRITKRESYELPRSTLGELSDDIVKGGRLIDMPVNPGDLRPYFWEYDGIELRDMTYEEYMINRSIIYDTQACVFYDSDVKLPVIYDELTEFEEAHLNFGCDDNRIEFAIYNSDDEYVGNINICGLDEKNGKFSYSIYVLNDHRGKGYGTKALRLLLWYCFNELRMNKMICGANDGNFESAAVMRRVGCHVEGVLRDNEYYHGKYVDLVLFGVTKEEFDFFNGF